MSEFFIESAFGADRVYGDADATARMLHLAGIGEPQVSQDDVDIAGDQNDYSSDSDIFLDRPEDWQREHLPQFGPPFVKFVRDRFDTMERRVLRKLTREWSYQPTTFFNNSTFQADGSGNVRRSAAGNSVILSPPPGWTIALHRLVIFSPNAAFTFGSPYTAASSFWELRVNEEMIDGGSLVSGVGSFPVAKTWGTRDAARIRDGEVASIYITGGAGLANQQIGIKCQGTWERVIEG